MNGKTIWVIPDGFMSDSKSGNYVSHEAVCVLNLNDADAHLELEIYFEDRAPMTGFSAVCAGKRSNHVRLDKLVSDKGEKIPTETPYSVLVRSDIPVIAQHSRMDVTQSDMTLMTTIPYGM